MLHMSQLAARLEAPLGHPPHFRSLIGPSFILLGLGLGSGELLLWPYLSANFGLGLIWGALVGITLQFILNLEIERYTLATGESVFVGLTRQYKTFAPLWFILSTFVPWIWPGIISTSALIISTALFPHLFRPLAIVMLLSVGLILTGRPTAYQTLERWQRISISIAIPLFALLTLKLAQAADWQALFNGLVGIGEGYRWLPPKLPIFTFLGALAYAGAGGNLNLAQSFYIKDKGFGMGAHANCSTSQVRGHLPLNIKPRLEGYKFSITAASLRRFHNWWRLMTIEHALVFWATGLITMLMLALLAYVTVYSHTDTIPQGVQFLFVQASFIASQTHSVVGVVFLAIVAWMLYSTHLTITDSTSRILAENSVLLNKQIFKPVALATWYRLAVWLQILIGCVVLLSKISEPFLLVTIGAALNAITMLVYSILIWRLNSTQLPLQLRPSKLRQGLTLLVSGFFGLFSILTIVQWLTGSK